MANPQLENGYTRIANEILEALARYDLSGSERRIIDVVLRNTYGFNRKTAQLSLKQIASDCVMPIDTVRKKINKLITENILLEITPPDALKSREIMFNKDYSKWLWRSGTKRPVVQKDQWYEKHQRSGTKGPGGVVQKDQSTYIKKNLKKIKKEVVQAQSFPKGFEGIKMLGDDD